MHFFLHLIGKKTSSVRFCGDNTRGECLKNTREAFWSQIIIVQL